MLLDYANTSARRLSVVGVALHRFQKKREGSSSGLTTQPHSHRRRDGGVGGVYRALPHNRSRKVNGLHAEVNALVGKFGAFPP